MEKIKKVIISSVTVFMAVVFLCSDIGYSMYAIRMPNSIQDRAFSRRFMTAVKLGYGLQSKGLGINRELLEKIQPDLQTIVAIYPAARWDASTIKSALVDIYYSYYTLRQGLLDQLAKEGIGFNEENQRKLLDGQFDNKGRLEFETEIDFKLQEGKKIKFIIYAKDYFDLDLLSVDFPKGFYLSIVKLPGQGGRLTFSEDNEGHGSRFYDKVFKESAAYGLVYVTQAFLPNERLIKWHGMEILECPDGAGFDGSKLFNKGHMLYRKGAKVELGNDLDIKSPRVCL